MIRRLLEVARDCAGAAFLEFALVLPVLLLVAFGITQFGLIFYHYTLGTNAAAAGTRQLSISFQDPHPYCDTINAMINAILGTTGSPGSCPTIPSDFTITLAVDGTPCASEFSMHLVANHRAQQPTATGKRNRTIFVQCYGSDSGTRVPYSSGCLPADVDNTGGCGMTSDRGA